MSCNYPRRTALALLPLLIVSGCSATDRLNRAATTKGQASAGIHLPAIPDDLRKAEPHAPIVEGQPAISTLARERQATDRANARNSRFVAFYTDVQTKFGSR